MGLSFTKIWARLAGTQDRKIVMVGLDAAGKTTVLYKLKLNELLMTIPTIGFNVETVEFRNIRFTVWDIGGQDKIRRLWRHYFLGTHGAIFVLDSTDRDRLQDAREELWQMLKDPELGQAALLILANKQDLPDALPPDGARFHFQEFQASASVVFLANFILKRASHVTVKHPDGP